MKDNLKNIGIWGQLHYQYITTKECHYENNQRISKYG